MIPYSTLDQLKEYLSLSSEQDSDDSFLLRCLHLAKATIDDKTNREFIPRRTVLYYDDPAGSSLCVGEDILEVKGLADYGGTSVLTNFFLTSGDDHNDSPYSFVNLSNSCSFGYSSDRMKSVFLSAIVGYREDYSRSWESVTSLPSNISLSTTAMSAASGIADSWGIPSRISVGHLLRIDSEFVYVKSGGEGSATFNVKRGVQGTSATSHASGTMIERYVPDPEINRASVELAAHYNFAARSPYTGKVIMPQLGTIQIQGSMPPTVKKAISRKMKRDIYGLL